MSDPSSSVVISETQAAKPPRSRWSEFSIFFALGFGVLFLYGALNPSKPLELVQTTSHKRGQPLLNLGVKSKGIAANEAAKSDVVATPVIEKTPVTPAATDEPAYTYTSWETLAGYFYEPPDAMITGLNLPSLPKPKSEIPERIKALKDTQVLVTGYMIPVQMRKGAVTAFVLCRTIPACCFGDSFKMNEWIRVTMQKDQSTQYVPDQQITVFGTLDVGEIKDEDIVISIYRMTADQVTGAPDL